MIETFYGIYFIDSNNEKQLLNSNAEVTPITQQPFYISRENAEKKARRLPQIARSKRALLNNMLNNIDPETQEDFFNRVKKDIADKDLIISNGVEICEIEVKCIF